MREFLNKIRQPVSIPVSRKIEYAVVIFITGIALGIVSKALDETATNLLPPFLEMLDSRNFFSRMGFWLFCGICVAIYSKTPTQAAVNNFLFFFGMVSSYYVYTIMIAGFYPKSYMMIWIAMTLLSPLGGVVCWYAKGTHFVSICISAILFMMMTRQAFNFGFWYFNISYFGELLLWMLTILVLYKKPKQIILVTAIGILLFFMVSQFNLFWGML